MVRKKHKTITPYLQFPQAQLHSLSNAPTSPCPKQLRDGEVDLQV